MVDREVKVSFDEIERFKKMEGLRGSIGTFQAALRAVWRR